MKVFAAHNPDFTIRTNSSSGGVFSTLATGILEGGGVVYGAAFSDTFEVEHKRITNVDDLDSLRRSKYVFSNFSSSVSDALKDLESGRRVLFSGTPCQIAAVNKSASDNPLLVTVEVICHGAPEPIFWEIYLNEFCRERGIRRQDIARINFRDKSDDGWKNFSITIDTIDGRHFSQPYGANDYMRSFLDNYTLRKACFRCPFKYPDGSKADISLGDLWGIETVAPQIDNNLGTTLVIARTLKGIEACRALEPLCDIDLGEAAVHNPAITDTFPQPDGFEKFRSTALNRSFAEATRRFTYPSLRQRIAERLAGMWSNFRKQR